MSKQHTMREAIDALQATNVRKPQFDPREAFRKLKWVTKAKGESRGNLYFVTEDNRVTYFTGYGQTESMTIEVITQ
jgi:hypothetical protein